MTLKLRKRHALMTLALVSAPAAATPTYLTCTLDGEKGPFVVKISADEANQVATHSVPSTGAMDRRPAAFTADEVKFSIPIYGGYSIAYTISRTDLSISRSVVGLSTSPTTGKCKVDSPPERAF